jgi:hypothetical protein
LPNKTVTKVEIDNVHSENRIGSSQVKTDDSLFHIFLF